MKKILCSVFLCLFSFFLFSQEYTETVPVLLRGIWQGSDRLILFNEEDAAFSCVLRVFYQWYDDRSAEPEQYAQISTRDRNDTTSPHAENIVIKYKTLFESDTSGAWELQIKYPGKKDCSYIPVAVINGKLYLKFFLRDDISRTEDNQELYFFKETGCASGITISPPVIKNELLSYFYNGSAVYFIRYWESDMEYTDQSAEFSDGDQFYSVSKFIKTGGKLFTCATGRSTKIRNIQKASDFPFNFEKDDFDSIYVYDQPYLVKVPLSGDFETLDRTVKENNKRRHPPVKPLFPVPENQFHWKEISDMNIYHPYTWNRRNIDLHK